MQLPGAFRIGLGYDLHRLEAGRRLVLGGVEIPYARGLAGHSDADVLTHAIIDALAGAAGLPDIGECFPDTDEKWRGAASLDLLADMVQRVRRAGWQVVQLDAVLVAEAPKFSPFKSAACANLARVLGIPEDAVNVKAKTNEGVGPVGRGEAMSAQAVCLIQSRSSTD